MSLLKELDNLRWAVLEIDATKEENPEKCIESVERKITKGGYKVSGIFENPQLKGLYHIHITRTKNA